MNGSLSERAAACRASRIERALSGDTAPYETSVWVTLHLAGAISAVEFVAVNDAVRVILSGVMQA